METKKVYIETLGCQMNKSDAERMYGMLEHIGYTQTLEPKEADLLIINTCSIRQLSEDKAYSQIGVWGKWKHNKPNLKIVFAGCVAQQAGEKLFRRAPYVDLVLGTQRLYELPSLIKRIEDGERLVSTNEKPFEESEIKINRAKSMNAWIPIMEGCNNFCTYCIVPYTRGRERSRKPDLIIAEIKKALSEGFKEITLLGQNVDSYGKGIKSTENGFEITESKEYGKDNEGNIPNLKVKGLFVAVGRVPENENFSKLINVDDNGYIEAGEDCKTNIPGIYTAGDNRTKMLRQLVTATSDGTTSNLIKNRILPQSSNPAARRSWTKTA